MDTKRISPFNWSVGVIIVSSIPLTLMMIGIMIELATWATINLRPPSGIEDTTLENALFFGGVYLAIPCGLLNIILGRIAQSNGWMDKKVAVPAVILGILGMLVGILSLTFVSMMSSFVF